MHASSKQLISSILILFGLIFSATAAPPASSESTANNTAVQQQTGPTAFVYPFRVGKLVFPQDEGKHVPSKWPFTLVEWFAHYTHLTADDGSTYFLFTTFVTFDPVEPLVQGKFPHVISAFVDINNGKTYHDSDMARLKVFAEGHANMETVKGDFFRWKGSDQPFHYVYHVARKHSEGKYAVDLDLAMVKPPLAINGTGFIRLPKGTSGYYSQTRLKASGRLRIDGVEKHVHGVHWVDRQWLGASFAGNLQYSYEWWALQLDNNEEAILFRIWDTKTDAVVMTRMEINHADGTREQVDRFRLKDLRPGWHLSAPDNEWDLRIVPACKGQHIWHSCRIRGTIKGAPVTGVAVAELARDVVPKFSDLLDLSSPTTERKISHQADSPSKQTP